MADDVLLERDSFYGREKVTQVVVFIMKAVGDDLTLSEIANKLGYSSVAHLSGQFKKVTGFSPSEMKKSRDLEKNRRPLDNLY